MSISVTVTISTVYPGSTGGAIFTGHDVAGRRMRFVADRNRIFRVPVVGEVWALKGVSRRHAIYGDQVHVEQATLAAPSGRLVIDFLVRHPAFNGLGIGKAKARRLWEEFGQDLGAVLGQGDMEKLTRVLSAECAQKLVEAWRAVSEEAGIVAFLDHHGFDLHLANKIRKVWPRDTLAKLRENPYRMLTFAAWEKVDRMARSLGLADDDPRRRIAAVEACLYRRLDAKHTLTSVGMLLGDVAAALRCGESTARAAIDRAWRGHAIIAAAHGYQPVGAAVMENVVAGYLRGLLAGSPGPERNLFSGDLAAIVAESIERYRSNTGLQLNAAQCRAVEMAVHHPLSVLTGGAGTGKTTVLRLVHDVAERAGVPVLQMALSGRAAQRLRTATGREASTIAAFLRAAALRLVDPASEPLIIIDESSMLDLPLTYSLVRALPARARLLLVGDPYQLPPIGFGLSFHVLAASPSVPRVELVEIHRQAQSSGIPQIADAVRHGVAPSLPDFAGCACGVNFIDAADDAIMDTPGTSSHGVEGMRRCPNPWRHQAGSQWHPRHQRDHACVCIGHEKEAGRVGSRRGRTDRLSGERLRERVVERVAGQNRSCDEHCREARHGVFPRWRGARTSGRGLPARGPSLRNHRSQSAGQPVQESDRSCHAEPVVGPDAHLHGFDTGHRTGCVHRGQERLRGGDHRNASFARTPGRLLNVNAWRRLFH